MYGRGDSIKKFKKYSGMGTGEGPDVADSTRRFNALSAPTLPRLSLPPSHSASTTKTNYRCAFSTQGS